MHEYLKSLPLGTCDVMWQRPEEALQSTRILWRKRCRSKSLRRYLKLCQDITEGLNFNWILIWGRLSVHPFSLCAATCCYSHSFWSEIRGHNSRGMEQRFPQIRKVRFGHVLSSEFTYAFEFRCPDPRLLRFFLILVWLKIDHLPHVWYVFGSLNFLCTN